MQEIVVNRVVALETQWSLKKSKVTIRINSYSKQRRYLGFSFRILQVSRCNS